MRKKLDPAMVVAAVAGGLACSGGAQAADPVISFTQSEISVNEGETATVTVQRSEPLDGQSVVDYGVRPRNPLMFTGDFALIDGTMTFDRGASTASFTVKTVEDGIADPGETANVVLANPADAVLGDPHE